MLSPKQLLINCATLLCLEHREGVSVSPSNDLVANVLSNLPIPEASIDHDHGRQTFLELRSNVTWLNSRTPENFPSTAEVIQAIMISCREEDYLYKAAKETLEVRYDDPQELIKAIQSYRGRLNQHLIDEKIIGVMKDYHHKLVFKRNTVTDLISEVVEMGNALEPLVKNRERGRHAAMMTTMDFSEVDALSKHFDNVKVSLSTEGAMRTGWQGVNRMLGKAGAFRRGEFVTVGALQHNFKSGFMTSLLVHFALFNKPVMRDKSKKPLIYFASLENAVEDNLLWVYTYIKENIEGEAVVVADIDKDEASRYVSDKLRSNGYEVIMERFDPTEFNAASFVGNLESIQADGYEIHVLMIDYLNMLSKSGIEAKVAGDDIRFLFRRIRNYASPRGILTITPHQLSSDALQLTRENVEDFVKVVANKGYYDGCRRLGQEPDLEIFIHIVKVNGKSYLTLQRGKHRGIVTPEKDLHVVLPFEDIGTIPWDVDKDHEITLAMPGGGTLGSDQEVAWWAE